jgi:5-methylcytosine-specific restriction endonuclease McrA
MTEAEARAACDLRDHGRCQVPGCAEAGLHLHHIIYRSHSRALQWEPSNLLSLCPTHHALVHAGALHIAGDARDPTITGDDFDLVALSCAGGDDD